MKTASKKATEPTRKATSAQRQGCLPPGFDEHSTLTTEQMAVWQQRHPKVVLRMARRGDVPAMRSGKSYRFHVGTVLATQRQKGKR